MKKVFAFDLGKASIGYCVREDFDIKEVGSIIINKDHAETISNRDRRRIKRTLDAHKAREIFFENLWKNCGLELLSKEDFRFKKEFGTKNDNEIYTSCLLRIALLQNKPLKTWQIYKALYNAFQRRGYDVNLAWANIKTDDDKKNEEYMKKYTQSDDKELIINEKYKYPCYYDAIRLGLWEEANPSVLKKHILHNEVAKVRTNGLVAPRELVEKELEQLWINAQAQIPELKRYSPNYFMYGEYAEAYGSYKNPEFKKYRGTERDWQGVLGQKIPRFDNRIISKCKLLPKRNVCKANTLENVSLVLLMKLKKLRMTDEMGEKFRLSPQEIKELYDNWLIKAKIDTQEEKLDTSIIKKEIEKITGKKIKDKIEPMKANLSGRSSFCRRACKIMQKFILSGELYPQYVDYSEFVDKENSKNGITIEEINSMISKIGDANNLYIPDNRDDMLSLCSDVREKTDHIIGTLTNPVVRNRLQIFRDLLLNLKKEYDTPDEVIFEFVREGADNSLFGKKKAENALKNMKNNEKENEQLIQELLDAGVEIKNNFEKLKLLKMQGLRCIYSGKPIGISDFNACEIDHIYPRAKGGNDALYNKVLCYSIENQNKKGRTPYEWLHNDEKTWFDYVNRLETIKGSLGKKKYELLTSKPEDCEKLIESYNGLAETAQIARLAQQMTAFVYGWGLQVEGEQRHIFVNNGSSTASIRRTYNLNKLLGADVKKNRENDKHHALDAICISFSRDYKYNKEKNCDEIKGLDPTIIHKAIEELTPYPHSNDKPFKGDLRPKETYYGKRLVEGKYRLTERTDITEIKQNKKDVEKIIDNDIKDILLSKLEENLPKEDWFKYLANFIHPKKQTRVKKVRTLIDCNAELSYDSNGRERFDVYVDFGTKGVKGQFKRSKGHKGQILYYNEKGAIKVMPIYANQKTQDVKAKLIEMGCKLYNKGEVFYSGCLLDIPCEFVVGGETYPAGIYKNRTIMSDGRIKLENNSGVELNPIQISSLAEIDFKKYKK